MAFKPVRVDESRDLVREMLTAVWGVYIKAEPKQRDQWRDQTFDQLYKHLMHEVDEVKRHGTIEGKLHNLLDLCGLAAICAAKLQLMGEKNPV